MNNKKYQEEINLISQVIDRLEERVKDAEEKINPQWDEDDAEFDVKDMEIRIALSDTIFKIGRWERNYAMMHDLVGDCDLIVEKAQALAFWDAKSNQDEGYNSSEAKIIASCNDQLLKAKKVRNKADNLFVKTKRMIDALESKKYILKDYTNLIVHGAESYELS